MNPGHVLVHLGPVLVHWLKNKSMWTSIEIALTVYSEVIIPRMVAIPWTLKQSAFLEQLKSLGLHHPEDEAGCNQPWGSHNPKDDYQSFNLSDFHNL